SRWDVSQYYDPDPAKKGKVYCKWLGMLDDIDCFDPLFFQISPAEAEVMDPQHRLFLEEGYKAFEDAGYSNATLSNKKCGVYLGIMSNEYSLLLSQRKLVSTDTTGNSYAIASARIAYYLNLKGPAISVDTACSSSLVAIHLACQALLNHEIDMSLAGGVSLYLTPDSYLVMCQAGMLSPEGQCKTFDDSANGFVPGEGVGAVVLKRLKDAERDNDSIHGVILGTGINQDGKTNGIMAPSVNGQIELEQYIYSKYNIDPETISYAETHGVGSRLGDPIELEALSTVFQEKTSRKNYCALASVKSNIGHTSGTSGVASVQKVLLSMKHQKLVPSLNCTKENTHFDFKNSPFYVSRETKTWDTGLNSLRRACVSSFGFSGTNAHLVLEEYPSPGKSKESISVVSQSSIFIIPLSARTREQLEQRAGDLLEFLRSSTPLKMTPCKKDIKDQLDDKAHLKEKIEALLAKLLHVKKDTLDSGQSFSDYGVERIHLTKLFETICVENEFELNLDEWIKQDSIESLLHYCLGEEKESCSPLAAETVISQVDLQSLAYTLQTGRESMEERLGFIVTSIKELEAKLEAYLLGDQEIDDFYQGQVKQNKDMLAAFSVDEELQEAIEKWIFRKKLPKLLDYWAKGLALDWSRLYGDIKPKRISLPTYPFEKRRCWIDNQQPTAHDLPLELRDKKQEIVSFKDVGNNGKHGIDEQLESIICEVIGIQSQELNRESSLHKDYGVDSVSFLKLQYEISERFSLTLKAEEFFKHNTISEFISSTILKSKSVEEQSRSEKQERPVSGSAVQNGNALSSTQRLMLNYNRQYKRVHTRTLFFQTESDVSAGFLKTLVSGILKQHVLFRCCFQRETYTYTENE
ncbi:MAG: hypothetical protein GY941_13835, partial [Planctomycetes bacterium]|nr:hypothetical protein [Planctomycetota bacterium]